MPATSGRVFLSYAYDDHALAQLVSQALAQSGIRITSWDASPGENLVERLREAIRASDVVILLVSPAVVGNLGASAELEFALSRDLGQRGVEVVPVLAAPTDLPPTLRNWSMVDLTKDFNAGLRQLVEQVQATSQADFSTLSPHEFEDLVASLLRSAGFRLDEVQNRPDTGVDLRATYQRDDPFGASETEEWLVQVKLYSHQRVSVDEIRRLAGTLAETSAGTRGLLVTNAQLTSVALEYVAELERNSRVRLRVLDGAEFKRLLRQFPAVVARHFGSEVAKTKSRADDDS